MALLAGCGPSQADFERLRAENESLRSQIDELQNGENRLVATIDKALIDKNYVVAKADIELLSAKHPESKKLADYRPMLAQISKIEQEENAKKEAEEKERVRLQNLSNTGIWAVRFYVDNFGEKTKKEYITNAHPIHGQFSNTATQDSDLNVDVLIDGPTMISIQLFEYAGRNPVKAISAQRYAVRVKDKDGQKYEMFATNRSDRLVLDESSAKAFHEAILKGGQVQVWIQHVDTPTDQYQFEIASADGYDNAFQLFTST